MSDKSFYGISDVKITSVKFILNNWIYALSPVSSTEITLIGNGARLLTNFKKRRQFPFAHDNSTRPDNDYFN
jgi:hypothetical protein